MKTWKTSSMFLHGRTTENHYEYNFLQLAASSSRKLFPCSITANRIKPRRTIQYQILRNQDDITNSNSNNTHSSSISFRQSISIDRVYTLFINFIWINAQIQWIMSFVVLSLLHHGTYTSSILPVHSPTSSHKSSIADFRTRQAALQP